jgi:hypothetical protein
VSVQVETETPDFDADAPNVQGKKKRRGKAKNVAHERLTKAIRRALGGELRRAREACGLSRVELADQLPSGIGDRTLLSYEHGTREMTFLRFLEICWVLAVDPMSVARAALQRARINLDKQSIHVDLRALSRDESITYRSMVQWARNALNEFPDGTVELEPVVVKHLALSSGCDYHGLVNHLARYIPDEPHTENRP